jgi:hypothetical protein
MLQTIAANYWITSSIFGKADLDSLSDAVKKNFLQYIQSYSAPLGFARRTPVTCAGWGGNLQAGTLAEVKEWRRNRVNGFEHF